MDRFIPIMLAVLAIVYLILRADKYKKDIEKKINSIGGTVINIERRSFNTGIGPFIITTRYSSVYRIEYRINGDSKIGWAKFGELGGPVWKL